MGPDKNPELFCELASKRVNAICGEALRRETLSLSTARFVEKIDSNIKTLNYVTEPIAMAKLIALSKISKNNLGIAGFDQIDFEKFYNSTVLLEAKASLPHDNFISQNGKNIITRLVKFHHPDITSEVDIIGLNIYQSEESNERLTSNEHLESLEKLLLVDEQGEIQQKKAPITGENVAFIVRDRRTFDAKAYYINMEYGSRPIEPNRQSVFYLSDYHAKVRSPDNSEFYINLIKGKMLRQLVQELEAGTEQLSKNSNVKSLNYVEKVAVLNTMEDKNVADINIT